MLPHLPGIAREQRIVASGVRNVFTPHQPIRSADLFRGRHREIQRLMEHINTPGQHALLYGHRGVGKSSLANVAAELIFRHLVQGHLDISRCDSTSTFRSVVAYSLRGAGVEPALRQVTRSTRRASEASLRIPFASAGLGSESEDAETYSPGEDVVSPAQVAAALRDRRGMLLIDEADRIEDPREKGKLADLIKHLSDSGSEFKILVVGIADTGAALTTEHASVQRCLQETRIAGMKRDELSQIIDKGADALGLVFDRDARDMIVSLSAGYPHFTHLLALICAEDAIADGNEVINTTEVRVAMAKASENAERSLQHTYAAAVRSAETSLYVTILRACAISRKAEFTLSDVRSTMSAVASESVSEREARVALDALASQGRGHVLKRMARDVYCFSDPRMPTYVRLVNQDVH